MTSDGASGRSVAPIGWKARARRLGASGRATVGRVRLSRQLADLETFCFFIGYARSGSTLVGSLLNAHPEIVIAHELDAIGQIERGRGRNDLFALLLQQEGRFGELGYQWTGYDYTVPGQWQGRFDRLRVIGDKRAGKTTHRLGAQPELLDRVRHTVGVPIRVVHIVRNPFDNVATMARRGQGDLAPVIENYRRLSSAVDDIRTKLHPSELFDVHYEEFSASPARHLDDLCRFLGVEAKDEYLEACVPLVRSRASRSREHVSWSSAERREIDQLIARRPVLAGYDFEH